MEGTAYDIMTVIDHSSHCLCFQVRKSMARIKVVLGERVSGCSSNICSAELVYLECRKEL